MEYFVLLKTRRAFEIAAWWKTRVQNLCDRIRIRDLPFKSSGENHCKSRRNCQICVDFAWIIIVMLILKTKKKCKSTWMYFWSFVIYLMMGKIKDAPYLFLFIIKRKKNEIIIIKLAKTWQMKLYHSKNPQVPFFFWIITSSIKNFYPYTKIFFL